MENPTVFVRSDGLSGFDRDSMERQLTAEGIGTEANPASKIRIRVESSTYFEGGTFRCKSFHVITNGITKIGNFPNIEEAEKVLRYVPADRR